MRVSKIIQADSWRSALRELALIIAGVLIALWAGGLHEERDARRREQVVLRQLLEATRANEVRARQAFYEDSVNAANSAKAGRLIRPKMPVDSIALLVRHVSWISDYHPLTGVYEALAQSGDLALIRNDSLRFALSRYTGEVAGMMPLLRMTEQQGLTNFMTLTRVRAGGQIQEKIPELTAIIEQFGMLSSLRTDQIGRYGRDPAVRLRRTLEAELGASGWSPPPLKPRPTLD